ncbi:glycerate kinase [Anopheles marshallii]|uniref:glycerate kinase n=1 Tax=Anopheles marshallii TaxID=1521116 RepID=UPI00237A0B7C|nr:glycerate kinase [Anopheles marshallii]
MIRSCRLISRRMSTLNYANVNKLREFFSYGVEAVKPKSLFEGYYKTASKIHESVNHDHKRYHVIGFGKAVLGMAVQMEKLLGHRLCSGCISIPVGTSERFAGDVDFSLSPNTVMEVIECARDNLPDERSLVAASKIRQIAHSMTSEDILCVLVSGGGSALLCLPKAPITLPEKLQIIKSLSTAGASIDELNYVRIALSDVKGGQLALQAKSAFRVYSYVISDIVGDPMELIASGPTVVPKGVDVNRKAKDILMKYRLWEKLPPVAMQIIDQPRDNGYKTNTDNNELFLLGSNAVAVNCIAQRAQSEGLKCIVLSKQLEGNVAELSAIYVELAGMLYNFKKGKLSERLMADKFGTLLLKLKCTDVEKVELVGKVVDWKEEPLLIVGAGEPTVCVSGSGKGGRNQELALRISYGLHELENVADSVYFLSAGTDGIDGPTDAAGAIGGAFVANEYHEIFHKDGKSFIENNDSYRFYEALNSGHYFVKTGHTGTNVMDLHMLLIDS